MNVKDIQKTIVRATELTALSVSRLISEQGFSAEDLLTEEESIKREKLIDQAGVDAMRAALTDIPFTLEVVGSEGRKHVHQYGEALPTLEGILGSGQPKLDMVNDVVEGSKAAKLNSPGAVSVIAISSHKGLMPTPSDIDYMDKLCAPAALKGKVSLKRPWEENLAEVVDTFSIKPSEITVVMMDRDRNAHYINASEKFGVKLVLIKAGDFLPGLLALTNPKTHPKGIHLLVGIGGFEEGVLKAVAAKALGSVFEGKGWSSDKEIQGKYSKIWSVDDLVSGKIEESFLSVSAITDDNRWFDLKGVTKENEGQRVTTLTVDTSGVNINTKLHH